MQNDETCVRDRRTSVGSAGSYMTASVRGRGTKQMENHRKLWTLHGKRRDFFGATHSCNYGGVPLKCDHSMADPYGRGCRRKFRRKMK